MKSGFYLFLIVVSLLLISCGVTETDFHRGTWVFKGNVVVTAEPLSISPDHVTTITTRCYPKFSGKGRIGLRGYGNVQTANWVMLSPAQDTFVNPNSLDVLTEIPAEFTANQTFEQKWQIKGYFTGPNALLANYYFVGVATMDSIYVADSLCWIYSPFVYQHSPGGDGYQVNSTSPTSLIIVPE